tara:strand:- start:162 stop:341 length:180 start_codon:yes stop_codon:yes gene_type:complete
METTMEKDKEWHGISNGLHSKSNEEEPLREKEGVHYSEFDYSKEFQMSFCSKSNRIIIL